MCTVLIFSSLTQRNPLFHPFVLFQAMRSGSVWFTWLKCDNHFALLLQCNHCLEMFLFFIYFLFSQAFTTMLAKRGTVFVRGCIGYHFDGLLSQLLVALHPLVLFIAMWLTSEDAGYDWVGEDVTECIVCVQDNDPFTFFPCPFIVQELCESRGGRPGLSVLTSLLVSVDVKNYWTVLRHWSQLVPNMSTDIWGH